MDSAKQEALVAAVAKNMATAHEGEANVDVRRGSKNHIPGASGFRHQIDVSVHTQKDLILYECKYWNANVDAEAILAFAARGIDIQRGHPNQVVCLNIVVRHDLTRGARRLAEAFNIQRQVAKSAAEFSLGYKTDRAAAVVDRIKVRESAVARLYPKT
jgi:hypothetical protein